MRIPSPPSLPCVLAAAAALLLTAGISAAPRGVLDDTIGSPSPNLRDRFGWAVSEAGGRLLVTDLLNDTANQVDSGSVYLLDLDGGLVRWFDNPAPESLRDFFGMSLTIAGDTDQFLVVGDPGDDVGSQNSGSAHIFDLGTGALLRSISNPSPVSGGNFGTFVINVPGSNDIYIGAPEGGFGGAGPGKAYRYDAATGSLQHTINNPLPVNNERFGKSIAVVNNHAVVSAFRDGTPGVRTGAAYVFNENGTLVHTLSGVQPGWSLGRSMSAVPGSNRVLIGEAGNGVEAVEGKAYVFNTDTGGIEQTLLFPGSTSDAVANFGGSVFADEAYAFIGAPFADADSGHTGVVYQFDISTGVLVAEYHNPEAGANTGFAAEAETLTVIDGRLFVGAYSQGIGPSGTGSDGTRLGVVHVFSVVPEPGTLGLLAGGVLFTGLRRRPHAL